MDTYSDHPHWKGCVDYFERAYVAMARAIQDKDFLQIEEEQLNVIRIRESAAFVFGDDAFDIDFTTLTQASERLMPFGENPE